MSHTNSFVEIALTYVKERYVEKYDESTFNSAMSEYQTMPLFAPDGNVFDVLGSVSENAHYIMRLFTQFYLTQAFVAMRVDMNNPNVAEDLSVGNIGTPGRIAKVWCGSDLHDDRELGGGRWSVKPRIAMFPNESKMNLPITKRVALTSNCSHHFLPFGTLFRQDSFVVVSYVPDQFVLGISKLQRLVDWVSQRFFLQEDLTRKLYEELSNSLKTESVYVGIFNAQHTCESTRGSKSPDGAFTSEYYGGYFTKTKHREAILSGF